MKKYKFHGSRDIAHCSGHKCPLREKCHRYHGHKTLTKFNYLVTYAVEAYSKKTKTCDLYWEIEK